MELVRKLVRLDVS